MENLLSIIVPVYNSGQYLEQCVNSILAETYPKIEIILVDDGSVDSSSSICDDYAQKYKNVISIHQMNGGSTNARLKGVMASRGKWVTFVDSDDWIDEDFYEVLNTIEDDCDLILSGIYRYYDECNCIEEKTYYEEGEYDKKQIADRIIPNMLWSPDLGAWALDPSLCTKIFKRELVLKELKKTVQIKSHYGDDTMVMFPLMFHVQKMKVVRKAFYYHRQRKAEVSPYYIQDELFLDKLYQVYTYLKMEFQKAGFLDIMLHQLEHFYFNAVDLKRSECEKRGYKNLNYSFSTIFPFLDVEKDSRVILYGAGKLGSSYMEQNLKYGFCNIILWVDKNYNAIDNDKLEIESPENIGREDYDFVIIAVDDYDTSKDIAEHLFKMGGQRNAIIWHRVRRCISVI